MKSGAIVFGNGRSRLDFDFDSLHRHYTTFGCNAFYRDHKPDYLICVDYPMIDELVTNNAHLHSKLYTQSNKTLDRYVEKYKLHYLPNVANSYDSGNWAIKLACELGYKKIYMLGFDYHEGGNNDVYSGTANYTQSSHKHELTIDFKWLHRLRTIVETYKDTEIIRIKATNVTLCSEFKTYNNYKEINTLQFKEIIYGI